MRYRLCYEIKGPLSFLSHLEIMRLWQRAALRSGLPVAWSEGFNPRPRISLGPARGVGIEGEKEYLDIEFRREIDTGELLESLNDILPEGVRALSFRDLGEGEKRLEAVINEAVYRVRFNGGVPADLEEKIAAFLAGEHCFFVRKSPKGEKEIDLRAYVSDMEVCDGGFRLDVSLGNGGSLRVAELLTVFDYWDIIKDIKIERTGLFVSDGEQRHTP